PRPHAFEGICLGFHPVSLVTSTQSEESTQGQLMSLQGQDETLPPKRDVEIGAHLRNAGLVTRHRLPRIEPCPWTRVYVRRQHSVQQFAARVIFAEQLGLGLHRLPEPNDLRQPLLQL